MKSIFTITLILLYASVFGQTSSIRGRIVTDDQITLSGINVQLEGTSYGTAADEKGDFTLNGIPAGSYIIVASAVGYVAKSKAIQLASGERLNIVLQLSAGVTTLQEVLVSDDRLVTNSAALTRTNTELLDLPQHVQVVNRSVIESQQLLTVDQTFRNVAGVNSSSSYGSVNFRGFTTNTRGFLTNGMKGSPYPEGVAPMLGNIERVEVIHGPTAILNGQGSLGGTINMVTKQAKKHVTANASVAGGSFDLFRVMGDVTGSLNKSKSLYFLLGTAYQQGGRMATNFDNENLQLYGSLKWDVSLKTDVQLNFNYTRDRSSTNWAPEIPVLEGLPAFSLPDDFNYLGSDSKYKGNSYQLQLVASHSLSGKWKANLLAAMSESRAHRAQYSLSWDYDAATNALGRSFTNQKIISPTLTINPYVNGEFNIGNIRNRIAAGIDVTYERSNYPNGIKYFESEPFYINSPSYESGIYGSYLSWSTRTEKFTYNTAGVYLQNQVEFSEKLKALIGIRYNNYFMRYYADDDAMQPVYDEKPEVTEAIVPRVGFVYQPLSNTSFYIDYNKGFIPQYGNERILGGPFDPEIADQYEGGFKGDFFQHHFQTTLSVYRITKKNVLVYYDDPSLPLGYGYKPLEQVLSKGVEVGLSGDLLTRISLIANFSFNETKISKSNDPDQVGKEFYNSPRINANGWITYSLLKKNSVDVRIGGGVNHLGERTSYFGTLPEYTVADAMASFTFRRYKVQLNVNNLADKRYAQSGNYVDYTPGMRRSFIASLQWSLN